MGSTARAFIRRHLPALALLVGIVWVATVVLLIIANPTSTGGGPT